MKLLGAAISGGRELIADDVVAPDALPTGGVISGRDAVREK
jgi:hypothetical protein